MLHKNKIVLLLFGMTLVLSGCATTSGGNSEGDNDPLEGANRIMYDVNDSLDRHVMKPVAEQYVEYMPHIVRDGVTNFFSNLSYLNVALNSFLQGKILQGFSDIGRFTVNSTFGIGGLIDAASDMGIPKNNEDFGQTLGHYGLDELAYLVVPLSGPNSGRDLPDLGTSAATNPLFYVTSLVTLPVGILALINTRANLLEATRVRDEAALDPYVFTREAYREKRLFEIYDGNPPNSDYEDIFSEEDAELPTKEQAEAPKK